MKNIIVVSSKGTAVAHGGAEDIVARGEGSFLANIKAINSVLETIPTEISETVCVYVQDVMAGIVTGSAIDYVKTGKTGSGNELLAEEVEEFKKFYGLFAERILNVRFLQHKWIKKENVELKKLVSSAWDALNGYLKEGSTQVISKQEVFDPDKNIREELDNQIIEAIKAKDFALVKDLQAIKETLAQPQVLTVQETVKSSTVHQVGKTSFGMDNADKAMADAEQQSGDAPIDFGMSDTNQIGW